MLLLTWGELVQGVPEEGSFFSQASKLPSSSSSAPPYRFGGQVWFATCVVVIHCFLPFIWVIWMSFVWVTCVFSFCYLGCLLFGCTFDVFYLDDSGVFYVGYVVCLLFTVPRR